MKVINVMAASLDGRIASRPGETDHERRALGFTNDDDRAHLKELLLGCDAVVVGSASLMASGGAWELKNRKGAYPVWCVLTNRGLPKDARFLAQDKLPRVLVSQAPLAAVEPLTTPSAVRAGPGVRNLVYRDRPMPSVVLDALRSAGCERVLLFGGGTVNREFYKLGLVDELILTVCPLVLGASAAVPLVDPELPAPAHFTLTSSHSKGNLVFLSYSLSKS